MRTATATSHTAITCTLDGLDHLVTDDAHAAGLTAGTGLYAAVCGHQVSAQPLASPPGPLCPCCAVVAVSSYTSTPRHRRGGRHRTRAGAR